VMRTGEASARMRTRGNDFNEAKEMPVFQRPSSDFTVPFA
jgi:hypothetical protein